MRVLAVVPARGGSKGIPRKNLRLLRGEPLLAYTARAAAGARLLSRVVLTTDDAEIAEVGRRCGLEVPFVRPAALAEDGTPMLPVVQHAVRTLEEAGDRFDAICLLHPTTPLRRAEDIDACIELLGRSGADSVVTFVLVPPEFNPHWVYFGAPDGTMRLSTGEAAPIPRRQELPPAYRREGSVYVTRRDVLMEGGTLYGSRLVGMVLDPEQTVDIDDPEDLARAEELLGARG